jgi:LAO/AO transport system kinase
LLLQSKKNILSVGEYVDGIINFDRTIFARAITLIESTNPKHIKVAQVVLKKIFHKTGNSIRIGITGAPGAGKSTFIEALGVKLCTEGHKLAILAVDPSSIRSRGSVLGDKTRMERLSLFDNVFIRPSPSGGTLGGVARRTRETILLCEAAGFDIIFVETVGVGQSEITVRGMVDFYLLLLMPGGGDELQGIKKGSVEIADAIIINKADGDNVILANLTRDAYKQAIHYLMPATDGWETPIMTVSSKEGKGIDEVWRKVIDFIEHTKTTGVFYKRRQNQQLEWFYNQLFESLKEIFFFNSEIKKLLPKLEKKVVEGKITPELAVNKAINLFLQKK